MTTGYRGRIAKVINVELMKQDKECLSRLAAKFERALRATMKRAHIDILYTSDEQIMEAGVEEFEKPT